jgi:mono/diheme cytochrome c family protein
MKRLALFSILLALVGCGAGRDKTNVELIQDQFEQPNLKSQEWDARMGVSGLRNPPAGTVPRGFHPYKYSGDPVAAENNLKNPLMMDDKVLARGAERYAVYCGMCHGPSGQGDGKVGTYLALKPPSLMSEKVRGFRDGRIFHIITDGQGTMGSYATQIFKEEDRWAIVNYIRKLQKGN